MHIRIDYTLRIQVCPKISGLPRSIPILFGWDWSPQSSSREGSGSLPPSQRMMAAGWMIAIQLSFLVKQVSIEMLGGVFKYFFNFHPYLGK